MSRSRSTRLKQCGKTSHCLLHYKLFSDKSCSLYLMKLTCPASITYATLCVYETCSMSRAILIYSWTSSFLTELPSPTIESTITLTSHALTALVWTQCWAIYAVVARFTFADVVLCGVAMDTSMLTRFTHPALWTVTRTLSIQGVFWKKIRKRSLMRNLCFEKHPLFVAQSQMG